MKFETHLHTLESSPCGQVEAKTAVREYVRAGYDGIVVTDHYGSYPLEWFTGSLEERLDQFLSGYRRAKEEGERLGLTVLFGAEIRLEEGPEDLLLYGLSPAFFLNRPDIYTVTLPELSEAVHTAGGVIVQAHPYREPCRPRESAFLDGVEIYNGNPRHDSRNALAAAFAEKNELLCTSGSDYHQLQDLARGGIELQGPIRTEQDFKAALLTGTGRLIRPGGQE